MSVALQPLTSRETPLSFCQSGSHLVVSTEVHAVRFGDFLKRVEDSGGPGLLLHFLLSFLPLKVRV